MKTIIISTAALVGTAYAQGAAFAQCGGVNWSGPTTCVSGYTCVYSNAYWSQCMPGTASTAPSTTLRTTTSSKASTSSKISTTSTSTKVSSTTSKTSSSAIPTTSNTGKVQYAGVNIAGFDFGCVTDGTCTVANVYPALAELGNPDGIGQMKHFYTDDHMNVFRLPVGWQYLQSLLGATLDATALATYDKLVQGCLATGAKCIIDIHNYARYNGGIIGQGGPTNAQFANLWSQLATKYASNSNMIFGIINEPHDVPSITTWAASVQAAVTAIRNAGATSQTILLPGNDWTSAGQFVSGGSGPALLGVTNPDGSKTGLVFDVHKYLDSDNSGTHTECVTNNIDSAFAPLATWLRANGRQAFLTETGGGNTASCVTYMCQQIAFLNANSDVYMGYVGWGAGSFNAKYELTETPTYANGVWTDTTLVKSCLAR